MKLMPSDPGWLQMAQGGADFSKMLVGERFVYRQIVVAPAEMGVVTEGFTPAPVLPVIPVVCTRPSRQPAAAREEEQAEWQWRSIRLATLRALGDARGRLISGRPYT